MTLDEWVRGWGAWRGDLARIGTQTAAATALTYLAAVWLGVGDISWAVIAALFTINLSADASFYNARGRIIGALLGIGLGLVAGWTLPGVLPGLLVAVVIANLLATRWRGIQYAAATAAIVALEPTPSLREAFPVAAAILLGTLIAVATSFALWPKFARSRSLHCLRAALTTCRDLLRLFSDDGGSDAREGRDALHARFLSTLEGCHDRIAGTRFDPRLPSGAGLGDAATAVEGLWHSIVILDRATADEYPAIRRGDRRELSPMIREVERRSEAALDAVVEALGGSAPRPDQRALNDAVQDAVAQVRERIETMSTRSRAESGELRGLYALLFALLEIELRLGQLSAVAWGSEEEPCPAAA